VVPFCVDHAHFGIAGISEKIHRMKISASIIVWNEEANIAALCEDLAWADEIVIVDSNSSDRTAEIARRYTDKVFQHEFRGYKDKHEFADAQTSGDWIFWIDADERSTPELRQSIEELKSIPDDRRADGYWIARKTFHLGEWIRFCGWYPDKQMRLYRKSSSYWDGIAPHETARVRGQTATLDGDLLHYPQRTLSDHHRVLDSYASLAAEHHVRSGARTGFMTLLLKPTASFFRTFMLKQGFRHGVRGLIISVSTAYGVFLKHAKVWEAQNVSK